jgi:catechol 2,3-dioxygenase-like lactoylglutathione lyase family enzyme
MTAAFSHLGICVDDPDATMRFYCEALGFEPAETFAVGPEFGQLMEVDDVALRSQFLARDGVRIELLYFDSPGSVGEPTRRPVNKLGLTHLSFRVDDVDAVAAKISDLGGTVLGHTRTTFAGPSDGKGQEMDFLYCTDPNGVRIELMRLPG